MPSKRIQPSSRALVLGILLLGLALSGSRCPLTLYTLAEGEEGSSWIEGCIEGPCLCPIAQAPLTGSFFLKELPTFGPGPERHFEVSWITWRIGTADGSRVTGRGIYTTSAPARDDQRLVLDLEIDGNPIGTIDSGIVPGGGSFPNIRIQALSDGTCFQSGVVLRAAPFVEPGLRRGQRD